MNTQALRAHPMMIIAATSITIFALVGSAAVLGWLPSSHGEESTLSDSHAETKDKPAKSSAKESKHGASNQLAATCANCGVVKSVNLVEHKGEGSGVGAVAGGVAGGLLGSLIGKGDGKTVATVAGAAGGAYAGHQVEKSVKSTKSYDIAVKMDNGEVRHFHQNTNPGLELGQRVKVVDGVIQLQS